MKADGDELDTGDEFEARKNELYPGTSRIEIGSCIEIIRKSHATHEENSLRIENYSKNCPHSG